MKILLELKDTQFAELVKATTAVNQFLFRDLEKIEHRGNFTKLPIMTEAHYSTKYQLGFLPCEVTCFQKNFNYDEVLSFILSYSCKQILLYEEELIEEERKNDLLS